MNWLAEKISKMTYTTKTGKIKPMTQYKFAEMCGLSRSHIKRIIENDTPIEHLSLTTINAIANGLGISLYDLVEKNKK
jgi:transcriptional regulator with XRE-family HTH domain